MKVITETCTHCQKRSEIEVDDDKYWEWRHTNAKIQDVFPDLSDEEREMMLTGIHPECWVVIFGDGDDD